ncbi:MAG: hypothetical protein MJ236_02515 [Clostridia bacterium]|nr:hypothetical protein [Clostridia bacterium]
MSGELEDRFFATTRGDSRISIVIAQNDATCKLSRENRFLIDDPNTLTPMAYILSKPLKIGMTYNDAGVYKFVLQEVTGTGDDNKELMIADYYKYFPKEIKNEHSDETYGDGQSEGNESTVTPGKKVWL